MFGQYYLQDLGTDIMIHILYNPKANNNQGLSAAQALADRYGVRVGMTDITKITDFKTFFANLSADDEFIICGGDGTLNHFANDTQGLSLPEHLSFCGTGTGYDLLRDIGRGADGEPVPIGKYIERLPVVTVNGRDYRFINGVGFGIDGYCCEVGDKMRETTDKPINYAGIAVKGVLFHFKPRNATVTVDDVTKTYQKVWIAATMNGRFYGGGMMAAPAQDRLKNETVSTVLMYGKGRLKTLAVFPSIFKGEHVKHTEMVEVLTGRDVTVAFDRPTALQIDGETFLGVTEYRVRSWRNQG